MSLLFKLIISITKDKLTKETLYNKFKTYIKHYRYINYTH